MNNIHMNMEIIKNLLIKYLKFNIIMLKKLV
jgi:hypothetical protein